MRSILIFILAICCTGCSNGNDEIPENYKHFSHPKNDREIEYNYNLEKWINLNIDSYEVNHDCYEGEMKRCNGINRNSYYPVILVVENNKLTDILRTKTRTPVKYEDESGNLSYLSDVNYMTVENAFNDAYIRINNYEKTENEIGVWTKITYDDKYGFPNNITDGLVVSGISMVNSLSNFTPNN